MRFRYAAKAIMLALVLGFPSVLFAQAYNGNAPSRGLFGERTLGQALKPGVGRYVTGLKNGPSGDFLGTGRLDAGNMFSTPWRRVVEPAPFVYEPVLPTQPAVQASPAPPAQTPPPEPAATQATMPATSGQANGGVPAAQPGPGGTEGSQSGATGEPGQRNGAGIRGVRYVAPQSGASFAVSSAAVGAAHYRPSPEMSARLSRIARARGIRTPSGITVAIGDGTAVLRGVVGTPYDRALLASLARLEPGIWRIDNQLAVQSQPVGTGRP
jgi:hypothetical protein